jgi:hypothetical protein
MPNAVPPPDSTSDPDLTHGVRTALAVVLARVQLARRRLRRGDVAAADAHLADAERHVHRAAAATEQPTDRISAPRG